MRFRGIALALLFAAVAILSLPVQCAAQNISLEALRRDGYGVVELKRPRPNVLTVIADVDGRKLRLLVDTGWTGEGVALHGPGEPQNATRTATVAIGNVQLRQVPLTEGRIERVATETSRRTIGAQGVVGTGFLRTCSAILDLQNLRLYLRPPGKGQRAMIGPALQGAGMAEIPFEITPARECLVDVRVNGYSGRMLLDTGAYHAAVDRRLTTQIGADRSSPAQDTAGHRPAMNLNALPKWIAPTVK